ncbi:hypothetical protein ISN45_Aa04g022350 [Arabidopsis thaliana x Arabidopsis arenosa]|uniref:Uncharacterized protein n=1 Tax=Arabidopsis thaliana x Arabidopsis arenosa TaxID=1240361 RepID=A0A8T2AD41_9BRAS|nr:hypothetical protein ISN45_Aa04g022350 [Arabidopsis thaliana x Arabidopsis arenosa]
MSFRRVVMVSGSHLLKRICTTVASPTPARSVENSLLWKRACTTSAAPSGVKADPLVTSDESSASDEKAKVAAREQMKKRKMFKELRIRVETGETVKKTLNAFIKKEKEEGISITEDDLFRWAKQLDKLGKHKHARQVYEWMEKKKMIFPLVERATYLSLINKTKGLKAAEHFIKNGLVNCTGPPVYRSVPAVLYTPR